MAYIFFTEVLKALGKKLNYESISNLYGNSFAKDSAKIVQSAYPLVKHGTGTGNAAMVLMSMPSKMAVIESGDKETQHKQASKTLGETSWFEEFLV